MSNNSESFMDLPFIRNLVAYPERTSRQVETIFSNALEQAKNPPQQQNFQDFSGLAQTNKEIARGISDILLSNQRGYDGFSRSMEDFSDGLGDVVWDMNQRIGDFTGSLQSIYGGQLPEGKSMFELGRQIGFNGKRTAVALAVHGGISDYQLGQLFHPDFVEYLNNGYSSSEVSAIQQESHTKIYELQEKQSDLLEKKRSFDGKNTEAVVGIDRQFSDINKEILEIKKQLLPSDQIKLLDFGHIARRKSLGQLVSDGIIDQKSLEVLIRHQKVEGNMALEFSRIVVKDEQGRMRPFVALDGIMGIMQETRINRKIGNTGIVQRNVGIAQREKINENLESIDESINDGFEEVSGQIGVGNKKLDKIDKTLNQLDRSIIDSKIETNGNLTKINDSLYKIGSFTYGVNFPEEKKLIDLVKDFGPEGKKTLLSLYAKGMIDESSKDTLGQLFSPALFNSLSDKNQNVLDVQTDKKNKIVEIQNQIKSLGKGKSPDIEKKRKQYQSELDELQQTVMDKEDLEYRDIYQKVSEANGINDLIEGNFLDDDVLELLVRNQKVDGQTSIDLARIMKVDENGINPKLTLDGDVGRWQQLKAQTLQGNMALKQRGMILNELGNVNENLGIIGHGIQRANVGIDRANENLELIEDGIQRTNFGIDQMNSNILAVGEDIGDKLMQTNEFLYGLIESNEETNALLEQNNYLMEESNFLNKVTNHLIVGLSQQVVITGAEIVNVLNDIGNLFVSGINKIVKSIDDINETNKGIFYELQKQSETLKNIDDKLAKPLDTQANEFFLYGMEILGLGEKLSKEDWKAALKSFERGLKLRNTHLYNLYGAATALKNLGKDKKSVAYLHRAYKIASKKMDTHQSRNIALDLAKLYMKNFKMDIAKYWLDQVIINDNDCIESYLLKARITNSLNQEEEFNVLLNIVYGKIIQDDKEILIGVDYEDVLKMIYKPISSLVDQNIQNGLSNKLIKLLPKLQKIGHTEVSRKIIEYVLFKCPQKLINGGVDLKSIISQDKEYFSDLYSQYLQTNFKAGNSSDFFALVFIGYKVIDFDILDSLITLGLEYDVDYIRFKNNLSSEKKQIYKTNIQNKIYALGEQGKYIWRDYLRNNPNKFE